MFILGQIRHGVHIRVFTLDIHIRHHIRCSLYDVFTLGVLNVCFPISWGSALSAGEKMVLGKYDFSWGCLHLEVLNTVTGMG